MLLEMSCYRAFLAEELARRTRAHPRYSQRAFARDLGLSPGELSEVLAAKRRLSLKAAGRIAESLSLGPTETKHLLSLVQGEHPDLAPRLGTKPLGGWQSLGADAAASLDRFRLVADWACFAILNLSECEGFRATEAWIGRRLGLAPSHVRLALGRLERVGLVKKVKGRWVFPGSDWATPEGIPSEAVRAYHKQMLEKAERALEVQPVGDREFAGVGFALDPRRLGSLKRDIADFIDVVVARYGKGPGRREVYQLEMMLFRLTEGGGHG